MEARAQASPVTQRSSATGIAARTNLNPTTATPSMSIPTQASFPSNYQGELGLIPANLVAGSGDLDHRSGQPYPGAAQLRQVEQAPNLSSGHPSNQPPSYAVPGVFSPQTGIPSPYSNNPSQFPPQPASSENAYYTSNPSPRSAHSNAYYPSDKPPDTMAAATATMQRPYPPIYHTPQSNSPASVTSPQSHDHARSMFAPQQQPPQLAQPMYNYPGTYGSLNQMHPSPYATHHGQPQMNPQSMLSYPPSAGGMSHSQMSQTGLSSSPRMKSDPSQHYAQTPQSQASLLPQQRPSTTGTPTTNQVLPHGQSSVPPPPPPQPPASSAAPGPIPATTPLVVRQDNNGVQWIAFEYSRDRVKMEYTIRCDVESVDINSLSTDFKSENCVYPRACVPKEQYKGNRLAYETDCNQVGWALAQLNACLRGKRGLIQRAVDSWRNSNQDPRLRSRRVRRQAKITNRSKIGAASAPTPGSAGPMPPAGLPSSNPMRAPASRPVGSLPGTSHQLHHHHAQHDMSPTGQESLGGSAYSTAPVGHRPGSTTQHLQSPHDIRPVHTFSGYQTHPMVSAAMGPSMAPPMQGMPPYGRHGGHSAMSGLDREEQDHDDDELFGAVPEGKRRKFILVEDTQKNARVRVKVTLDQIEMSQLPDSYRKSNSVYPRSWYAVQMPSADDTNGSRFAGGDVEEIDDGPPTVGSMTVACPLSDGEGEVQVARLAHGKRDRERKLNELGYRMAWGQSRVFSNRPIFLGRALDHYRNKQRTALTSAGQDTSVIPSHLETRIGKRRWHERTRSESRSGSPMPSSL